jgi:hypothetical protein
MTRVDRLAYAALAHSLGLLGIDRLRARFNGPRAAVVLDAIESRIRTEVVANHSALAEAHAIECAAAPFGSN